MLLKRSYFAVFLVALLLSCSACGAEKADNSGSSTAASVNTDDVTLTYTYKVPLEDLYIDVPDFHYQEEGMCQLFMEMPAETMYTAFVYRKEETPSSLEEARDLCEKEFTNELYMHGSDFINKVEESKNEVIKVGEMECLFFEGQLICDDQIERKAFYCGYSFILPSQMKGHDISYTVYGVVKDINDTEKIELIRKYAYAMIKSVRETN